MKKGWANILFKTQNIGIVKKFKNNIVEDAILTTTLEDILALKKSCITCSFEVCKKNRNVITNRIANYAT